MTTSPGERYLAAARGLIEGAAALFEAAYDEHARRLARILAGGSGTSS